VASFPQRRGALLLKHPDEEDRFSKGSTFVGRQPHQPCAGFHRAGQLTPRAQQSASSAFGKALFVSHHHNLPVLPCGPRAIRGKLHRSRCKTSARRHVSAPALQASDACVTRSKSRKECSSSAKDLADETGESCTSQFLTAEAPCSFGLGFTSRRIARMRNAFCTSALWPNGLFDSELRRIGNPEEIYCNRRQIFRRRECA